MRPTYPFSVTRRDPGANASGAPPDATLLKYCILARLAPRHALLDIVGCLDSYTAACSREHMG